MTNRGHKETIIRINQLDPGDENCENFAFVPYPHLTPGSILCMPSPVTVIRLNETEERNGFAYWVCKTCSTELEFTIPLDSDLEIS
jgi:hypothetical protein